MIERIEDVDDERLRFYSKFTDAQLMNYPKGSSGMFIAESRLVIERAMKAGARPVSLFVEDRWFDPSRDLVNAIEAIDPKIPILRRHACANAGDYRLSGHTRSARRVHAPRASES